MVREGEQYDRVVVADTGVFHRGEHRGRADGTVLRRRRTEEKVVGGMTVLFTIVIVIVGVTGFLVGFAFGQEYRK